MLRRSRLPVLVLLGSVLAAPAAAQPGMDREYDLDLSGAVHTTAVSGTAGSATILDAPAGALLVGWEFTEDGSDRPCTVTAMFASWWLDPGVRDYTPTSQRSGSCAERSPRTIQLDQGYAIRGLQVCQRRQNGRLKGVKERSAAVTPTGFANRNGLGFERPNCNDWQNWVDCPAGQLAVGLVVHREGEVIQGLALRCRAVEAGARPGRRAPAGGRPSSVMDMLPPPEPTLQVFGGKQTTAVSGTVNAGFPLNGPAEGGVITTLVWGERSDRPCFIGAVFLAPDGGQPTSQNADMCAGGHGQEKTVTVYSPSGDIRGIGALQVCQRSSNGRLKGIRLHAVVISDQGVGPIGPVASSAEMANCNDWSRLVRCPSGTVATGIHINRESGNDTVITGLALDCREARYGS